MCGDFMKDLHQKQKIAYAAAQQELAEYEEKFRTKTNKNRKIYPIKEGYRVYIQARTPAGKNRKLSPRYEGPYRVIRDLGRQRFQVKHLLTGKEKTVHSSLTKIVPERVTTREMNNRVKLPHPQLVANKKGYVNDSDSEESVEENEITSRPLSLTDPRTHHSSGEALDLQISDEALDLRIPEVQITDETLATDEAPPCEEIATTSNANRHYERGKDTGYHLRPRPRLDYSSNFDSADEL